MNNKTTKFNDQLNLDYHVKFLEQMCEQIRELSEEVTQRNGELKQLEEVVEDMNSNMDEAICYQVGLGKKGILERNRELERDNQRYEEMMGWEMDKMKDLSEEDFKSGNYQIFIETKNTRRSES